jgi:RimJ/RimL family protein N-acetyltransferase
MRIERATDAEVVRSIVSHPDVKPEIWDGEEDPPVPMHELVYYLIVRRDGDAAGVIAFIPRNAIVWDAHAAVLPEHRGCGTGAMRLAVKWMFENTPCRKVVCEPPAFKVAMVRVLEKNGFHREGISTKSFQWHGELHDRVLMGIEKGN